MAVSNKVIINHIESGRPKGDISKGSLPIKTRKNLLLSDVAFKHGVHHY